MFVLRLYECRTVTGKRRENLREPCHGRAFQGVKTPLSSRRAVFRGSCAIFGQNGVSTFLERTSIMRDARGAGSLLAGRGAKSHRTGPGSGGVEAIGVLDSRILPDPEFNSLWD